MTSLPRKFFGKTNARNCKKSSIKKRNKSAADKLSKKSSSTLNKIKKKLIKPTFVDILESTFLFVNQDEYRKPLLSHFILFSEYLNIAHDQWCKIIINTDSQTMRLQSEQLFECKIYKHSFCCQRLINHCPCALRAVFWHHLYIRWCIAHQISIANQKLTENEMESKTETMSMYEIIQSFKSYSLLQLIDDCEHVDSAHRNDIPSKYLSSATSPVSPSPLNRNSNESKIVDVNGKPIVISPSISDFSSSAANCSSNALPTKLKRIKTKKKNERQVHTPPPTAKKILSKYNQKQKQKKRNASRNNISFNNKNNSNYRKIRRKKYREIVCFFYKYCGECFQDNNCSLFVRNQRDRDLDADVHIRREIYFNIEDDFNVFCMNKLDSFHTLWFHSYSHLIKNKKNRKNSKQIYPKNMMKFITTVDQEMNSPQMLSNSGLLKKNLLKQISSKSIKHHGIGNNSLSFQFGEHFEYWLYFEDLDNYISPLWTDLKEELLNNEIFKIAMQMWTDTALKAEQALQSSRGQRLLAGKNFYNDITLIEPGELITIPHLCTVLFYTNHSLLQQTFKTTMRLPSILNHIQRTIAFYELKQKNAQIAIWCRLLFESVRMFGTIMTSKDRFFHGISQKLVFEKFFASFECPMSTTTDILVAKTFRQTLNGIVLCVSCQSDQAMISYLDVSWMSNYRREDERLFYGAQLQIVDILYRNQHMGYFIRSLTLFQSITSGNIFAHDKRLINMRNQKRLIFLIKHHMQIIERKRKKLENKKGIEMIIAEVEEKVHLDDIPTPLHMEKSCSGQMRKVKKKKKKKSTLYTHTHVPHTPFIKHQRNKPQLNIVCSKTKKQKKKKTVKKRVIQPKNINEKLEIVNETKISSTADLNSEKKEEPEVFYYNELFDYYVNDRRDGIVWVCASQLELLHPALRDFFIKTVPVLGPASLLKPVYGTFIEYWKKEYNVRVELTHEFKWRIENKLFDKFMSEEKGEFIHSNNYLYRIPNDMQFPQRMSPLVSRIRDKSSFDLVQNSTSFEFICADTISEEDDYKLELVTESDYLEVLFFAECGKSKDDPGWVDFFWNVAKIDDSIMDIEVALDVYCEQTQTHDIYESEWMIRPPVRSLLQHSSSIPERNADDNEYYFGGKVFRLESKFFGKNDASKLAVMYDAQPIKKGRSRSLDMNATPKFSNFAWQISLRVTDVTFVHSCLSEFSEFSDSLSSENLKSLQKSLISINTNRNMGINMNNIDLFGNMSYLEENVVGNYDDDQKETPNTISAVGSMKTAIV